MSGASVKPVRVREHSAELGCDVVRVVSYRAVCTCGYEGSSRASVSAARIDLREHLSARHGR